MTHEQFTQFQETVFNRLRRLSETKGLEYSDKNDRLSNFYDVGKELGISPVTVLMTYSKKHSRAIESYCRLGRTLSEEEIEGRVIDRIMYDILLLAILREISLSGTKTVDDAGGMSDSNKKLDREGHTVELIGLKPEWDFKEMENEKAKEIAKNVRRE